MIVLASAARTATTTSATFKNNGHEALYVTLDVSAVTLTPSLILTIDRLDVASGNWINVLTGAAVTTVSTNVYKVAPQLTAAANSIVKDYAPSQFRVVVTHADADSATYSVGAELLA